MNITVSRLEQYPSLEPTGYAVGFNCLCPNGRSFYTDTVVSFDVAENEGYCWFDSRWKWFGFKSEPQSPPGWVPRCSADRLILKFDLWPSGGFCQF